MLLILPHISQAHRSAATTLAGCRQTPELGVDKTSPAVPCSSLASPCCLGQAHQVSCWTQTLPKDQAELTEPAWLVTQGQRQVWMRWGERNKKLSSFYCCFLGTSPAMQTEQLHNGSPLSCGWKVIFQVLVFNKKSIIPTWYSIKNPQLGPLKLTHALKKVHQFYIIYIIYLAALLYGKESRVLLKDFGPNL